MADEEMIKHRDVAVKAILKHLNAELDHRFKCKVAMVAAMRLGVTIPEIAESAGLSKKWVKKNIKYVIGRRRLATGFGDELEDASNFADTYHGEV